MRRTIFLTSLKTALLAVPLLVGCGGNTTINPVTVPPGGLTLPDCLDGQLIAVGADRTMSCTQALTAGLAPPDCSAVANSALNAYDGILECMPKGAGGTNAGLKTIINKVKMDTDNIETSITSISGGGSSAKWCGQYTTPVTGAITGNNAKTGVEGAANLCSTVQGCGVGAHMCTVYEMYEIAAAGGLPATVSRSWVYMQSWQHNEPGFTKQQPGNGLSDNCAGFTYGTGDFHWYGTTVEWKASPTAQGKALWFASGPSSGGSPSACGSTFPIACCQ